MNTQMAYLIGMILGNGEVQRKSDTTTITVESIIVTVVE